MKAMQWVSMVAVVMMVWNEHIFMGVSLTLCSVIVIHSIDVNT